MQKVKKLNVIQRELFGLLFIKDEKLDWYYNVWRVIKESLVGISKIPPGYLLQMNASHFEKYIFLAVNLEITEIQAVLAWKCNTA